MSQAVKSLPDRDDRTSRIFWLLALMVAVAIVVAVNFVRALMGAPNALSLAYGFSFGAMLLGGLDLVLLGQHTGEEITLIIGWIFTILSALMIVLFFFG